MTTDPADAVRRPRCRVLVSGRIIDGCQSIEVSTSSSGQAGNFFIQVAGRPDASSPFPDWSGSDTIDVVIEMGFLPSEGFDNSAGWQEMMSGRVDRIRIDPVYGTITLEGRDYAARLLDLPIGESFLNSTSIEVARQIADRCSLSLDADPTSSMVGQYYQIEHVRSALSRFSRFGTAWDLLSTLAQFEGFDVWVTGATLYFKAAALSSARSGVIDFRPADGQSTFPRLNVSSLSLERSPAVNEGRPVIVTSWNSRQRRSVRAQAGAVPANSNAAIAVLRPNLLQDAAQMLANGIYQQTSLHARTLSATMPGDLTLSPRDVISLLGVGGVWDGSYRVDTVDREISLAGGFVQRFTARAVPA